MNEGRYILIEGIYRGIMIKNIACLLLAIILLITTGGIVMATDYELDGGSVYVDNKDYYIRATPSVLGSSGWVDIEFQSKKYDSVDIVFQFPGTDGVVTKFIQFQEEQERIAYTEAPQTTYVSNNVTQETEEVITYTLVPYTEYYQGWTELDVEQVYTGKDGCWTKSKLKDKLTKGQLYKARVWVDIPISYNDPIVGKYSIGLKPWDKTIDEADSMGLLHLLDPWYNSDWAYRQSFTLSRADGAVADYQMRLTVNKTAGDSAGNVTYLDNHSLNWTSDIRFTESDGETLLDYWIESSDANEAAVWVEFDSIGTEATTFYIYYGNADATAVSSGADTFLFFDNFNAALDAQWDNTSGTPTTAGGLLKCDQNDKARATGTTVTNNFRQRFRTQVTNAQTNADIGVSNSAVASNIYADDCIYFSHWTGQHYRVVSDEGALRATAIEALSLDTWYLCEITYDGTTGSWYLDDVTKGTTTVGVPDEAMSPRIENVYYGILYADWYFLAKFSDPEPTWGDWGAEEEQAAPTVTNSAADEITPAGADLHGEITVLGGCNSTIRGFEWDTGSGAPYANEWHEDGSYGLGVFEHTFADMPMDTTIYWRAYATNPIGTGYSGELFFDTLVALPEAPTDFTITKTGVDEVTLTWTTGAYADTTYIRVNEDNYPVDRTDGYLVYDGALETATLDGLELTYGTYCFRAWGENAGGFSADTADEKIGGEMLLLILFGFMALGLTGGFFWKQAGILGYGAAGMWALLGFTAFQSSSSASPAAITDTYMALFWLCMAFVIGCALLPTVMQPKVTVEDDGIDEIDRPLHDSFKKDEEDRAYIDKIMPRRARRARNPRKPSGSVFDKTGIIGRAKR